MKKGSSGQFTARSYYQFDDRIGGFQVWLENYPESELEQESICRGVHVLAHLNNLIEFHASVEGVP